MQNNNTSTALVKLEPPPTTPKVLHGIVITWMKDLATEVLTCQEVISTKLIDARKLVIDSPAKVDDAAATIGKFTRLEKKLDDRRKERSAKVYQDFINNT
jgi:hypothetical protein